jgi:hypothetical protein
MSSNSPESPKDFTEQRLVLPWLILKRDGPEPSENSSVYSLLVSCPDGTVLEFDLPEQGSKLLGDVLQDQSLWKTFFGSLVNSFKGLPVVGSQESNATT